MTIDNDMYSLNGLWSSWKLRRKTIFSDEAHFWMNGYVNKENCRIWDMHPEKLTVWCEFWAGGVIGLYFFENDVGQSITVNGERYRSMITNLFWPELDDIDNTNMRFQQDGAMCHTAHAKLEILHERFESMIISRGGDVNWPSRL